jgi:hypothetical protein
MHLGLDFDNVVVDSHSANINGVNKIYNTSFHPESTNVTIYTELVDEPVDTEDELLIKISSLIPIEHRLPVLFAPEIIRELSSNGFQFTIITARPDWYRSEITGFCEKNSIHIEDVICLDNRYSGYHKKAEACLDMGLEGLIDDQLMYLEPCFDLRIALLLHKPWNKDDKVPSHVTRANDWLAIRDHLLS